MCNHTFTFDVMTSPLGNTETDDNKASGCLFGCGRGRVRSFVKLNNGKWKQLNLFHLLCGTEYLLFDTRLVHIDKSVIFI